MSFVTLSQQLTQLYVPTKNGNLYGRSLLHHWSLFDAWNYLPPQKPANTLLRKYQKDLVPDLPHPRDDKEAEKRLIHHLNCGCRTYEHPGLNEFLYTQSCLGHKLRPLPEKPPLNKKKPKQKEELLPLPEQMHQAYIEAHKHDYDEMWERYLEYVEAMKLADHIVQQNEEPFGYVQKVPSPTFTITQRKSRTPMLMHGRVI